VKISVASFFDRKIGLPFEPLAKELKAGIGLRPADQR
jgi:hypothetical protein